MGREISSNDKCDMSLCPVNKAMEYLSKKWSIEIIRDMFFGKTRFSQFKEDKPKLSNKVLSDCLKHLESKGIIKKRIISDTPTVTEYYLTERGKSLNKVIYELAVFTIDCNDNEEYLDESARMERKKEFREILDIDIE
ncbi:winged helix-turn-helix transcriptional regulator [Methanobacterium alcaliphilum]|uniref:winged helix-turn-helix transcriptional regulator n=1 Tax=Methanobacterium alcaliphilum TaxID=392018 RepID=UPI00200ABD50|nr:helix-turn-helix domain-containing protein [Methanobacterium alcaliphilum]MCK9150689.1 helix-turn-helix transcriptional regulator [Methanobacterium alcaliphilum]